MAWRSSTLWAGEGGEGPKRDDSMIERSSFVETSTMAETPFWGLPLRAPLAQQ